MKTLETKVKFLTYYAMASTLFFSVMLFSSFTENNKVVNFDEINVKRINVVEKNGTIRMVISNKELQHSGRMNGKDWAKRERPAGMIFFNDKGDECGGLIYQIKKTDKGMVSGMSITMDKFNDDQVVQILNDEYLQEGNLFSQRGLIINDFPASSDLEERTKAYEEAKKITDEKLRKEKLKEIQEKQDSRNLMFVGKTRGNSQGIFINDQAGRPKMMIFVDDKGKPRITTFNDKGEKKDFITE
ncbi:MAG: hypothetical protein MUC49_04465 [Raineya sp.]|jgi:hypothetical protein|nr:hypothetical protein [Raineya sp.]